METKRIINQCLLLIGHGGLGGVTLKSPDPDLALQELGVSLNAATRQRLLTELRRQKLVEITKKAGGSQFQLTVKGIHRLQRAQVSQLTIATPKTWDRKWRLITYDVPVGYSKQRQLLSRELQRLGFTMIQESSWFYPYPCFDAINQIINYCGLQRYVTVAEISRIDESTSRRLLRAFPDLSA